MNRYLLTTLILLALATVTVTAEDSPDPVATFAQANEFYADQEYDRAAELYQALVDSGIADNRVEYNLGNALYRLGKVGEARLHFERAVLLDPDDRDSAFNISHIENRFLKQPFHEENLSAVDRVLWGTFTIVPRGILLLAGIAAYLLLNALIFLSIVRKNALAPALRWSLIIALVIISFVAFSVVLSLDFIAKDHSYAIITGSDVGVTSEPSRQAPGRFQAPEGTKVRITRSQGDWFEVMLPNGSKGWVLNTEAEAI